MRFLLFGLLFLVSASLRAEPKLLADVPLVVQTDVSSPDSLDISPDGLTYAVGRMSDARTRSGVVDLFDLRTNRRLRRFSGVGQVVKVAFSPDGRFLFALHEGGLSLQTWDIENGTALSSIVLHGNRTSFGISGDSTTVVTVSETYGESHAQVWHFQTKETPREVKLTAVPLGNIIVDQMATRVAGFNDGFQIVSLVGGQAIKNANFRPAYFYFTRDGRLVGATDSKEGKRSVMMIDATTGAPAEPFTSMAACSAQLAVDEPGSRLCTFVLTPRTKPTNTWRDYANANDLYPYVVNLLPDGRHSLHLTKQGQIWYFDEIAGIGDDRRSFKLSDTPAVFTARGEMLVALSKDRVASLWDLSTGSQVLSHSTYASTESPRHPLLRISPRGNWVLKYGTGSRGEGLEVVSVQEPKKNIRLADPLPDWVDLHDPFSSYKKEPCFDAEEKRVGVFRRHWQNTGNDRKWLYVVDVWDLATGKKLAELKSEEETACTFEPGQPLPRLGSPKTPDAEAPVASPDGQSTAKRCQPLAVCIEAKGVTKRTASHERPVTSVQWSGDGRFVVSRSEDLVTRLWNPTTGALVASMMWNERGWTVLTPDNFYMTSAGTPSELALRFGNRAVPIQQFDLALNRPDAVIRALGGSESLAESYAQARAKRLKKSNITEESLRSLEGLPQLKVVGAPSLVTEEKQWTFDVQASGTRPLARLNVSVNGIAAFGSKGVDLKGVLEVKKNLTVALALPPYDGSSAFNLVMVSAVDVDGRESVPEAIEVSCVAAVEKPAIYVVAIGVSKYQNPALDLRFAAKDAKDVAALMARATERKYGPIAAVKTLLITDEQATRENILKSRDFLSKAGPNDIALVFLAGHGLLDEQLDYYFATHDIDPDHPEVRGLPYADLDALVDGIAARRRLVLMDTCHAGELDKDDTVTGDQLAIPHGKISARGVKVIKRKSTISAESSQFAAADLFADLRRRSGATIVGSSSGAEFALESPTWNNGVFTYALREAFFGGRASSSASDVRVENLLDYLVLRVENLTGGQQHPSVRQGAMETYRLHPGLELPRDASKTMPGWE